MGSIAATLPLIATKLAPPVGPARLVRRRRLLDRLAEADKKKLVAVIAPAGYGKTSLLAEWHRLLSDSGVSAAWLTLEPADRDPGRFLAYLVAAIRRVYSGFGGSSLGLASFGGAGLPVPVVTNTLINEIAALEKPLFVFLDDFHDVAKGPVSDMVEAMLRLTPSHFHLVLASREFPPLAMGRLRAWGQSEELTGEDLQFSREETAAFLELHDRPLDDVALDALQARTEGWVAGLQLATLTLNRHAASTPSAPGPPPAAGVHWPVKAFLAEEVLDKLDSETVDFLLKTSILRRLAPPLCDAVTGRCNGQAMLNRLHRLNLFVSTLDAERAWYRYHHLFADFLRSRLEESEPELADVLHERASRWFDENGHVTEAIEHAFDSRNLKRAAELLNRHGDRIIYVGQYRSLVDWAGRLPDDQLRRYPHLRLNYAWMLICEFRLDEASTILRDMQEIFSTGKSTADSYHGECRATLESLLLHREAMLALFRDNIPLAEDLFRRFLDKPCTDDPYLLGSAEISLVYCQGEMFRGNPAGGRIARAYELFHRSVGRAGEVWCAAFEGPGQVLTGDLDGAEKTYRRATAIGADISGERSPLVAMPALLLASLLYERNELAEATRVLDSYMPFAGSFGLIEQSISAYVTRFRLLDRAGERRAARALALEGMRYADAKGFGRFKAHLVNEQLAAAFREGDVDTGLRLARQHGLDGSNPPFLPAPRVTTGEETLALAWARAALVRGAAATASRALKRWWRHALDRGYRGSVVRVGVVLARALLANGARGEAQRVMREVLATAAATGMVRTVVDEGPVLEGLIAAVAMRPGAAPSRVVDHASRLLEILRAENPDRATPTRTVPAASEEPEPGAPVEPLRWREIEILQRVEAGLLNREIAHELGIAETTVTWHLRTIYQKLGVHRRVHAVARAREFGYL